MSDSFRPPWTIARQAPLSMGFSTQEYWSGLPCPPPGNLPDPGIEPVSLLLVPPRKPQSYVFPKESPRYCTPREIIHGKEMVLSEEETYKKSMDMILEAK